MGCSHVSECIKFSAKNAISKLSVAFFAYVRKRAIGGARRTLLRTGRNLPMPILAVKGTVHNGLGNMIRTNGRGLLHIGDGTRDT